MTVLTERTSGRNSGVLHAGIYYAQESLKAQFCLKDFNIEYILPGNKSGNCPQFVDWGKRTCNGFCRLKT